MKHYNDKILSMYFLESKDVENERELIHKHLNECYSCRELYEEIKEFYQLARGEKLQLSDKKNDSIILSNPKFSNKNDQTNLSPLPQTFPQKIFFLVYQNPITTGISLIAAALILAMSLNWKYIFRDSKPTYFEYDERHNVLEVFNKRNEKLWGYHYSFDSIKKLEANYHTKYSVLTDLDNDGKMELVTIVPNINDVNEPNYLKIFDEKGMLKFNRKIGREIKFEGKNYEAVFPSLRGLIVDDLDSDGKKEIYVGAPNRNSPYLLSKFDENGNLLGEYWHYGHFWEINKIDLNLEGKKGILLCGENDKVGKSLFVILDPVKMNRKNQTAFSDNDNDAIIKKMSIGSAVLDKNYKDKSRFLRLISESKTNFTLFYTYNDLFSSEGVDITFDKTSLSFTVKPTDYMKQKFEFLRRGDSTATKLFSILRK